MARFHKLCCRIVPQLSLGFCTDVPGDAKLMVLQAAAAELLVNETSSRVTDRFRETAGRYGYHLDLVQGKLRWFGSASFAHQISVHRLELQLAQTGHTVCPDASIQYDDANLRSHDISVWREDIDTIKSAFMPRSKTRIDAKKAPPYVVIEVISPESMKKDEEEVKELCARNGVMFYWLVHPIKGWIEVWKLNADSTSEILQKCFRTQKQTLKPFCCEFDLTTIFV